MSRSLFVKNFLTNFPQNFSNKLAPATTFRALKSENRCTPLLQRSKYIGKYPKALSGPVDIPGLGLTGSVIYFR